MDTTTAAVIFCALFLIQCMGTEADSKEWLDCLGAEDVTEEEARDFLASNFTTAESNKKLKCLAACILEQIDALDNNCVFRHEELKQKLINEKKDLGAVAVDACKDSAIGDDRCECGYQIYKCLIYH